METNNSNKENQENEFKFNDFYQKIIPNYTSIKIKMKNLPIFGNCLVTTQEIKKQETILQIPESLFTTISSIQKNPFINTQIL